MRLDDLLIGLDVLDMQDIFPDIEIGAVTCDSRKIVPGSIFVAITGERADGHDYISTALDAGATLVVQSNPIDHSAVGSFLRVADSREALAWMSARLMGEPSKRIRIIGVTGTNGKTSTSLIARHLLNFGGYRAAALGTLGLLRHDGQEFEKRGLTTPDAGTLQELLRDLVDSGTTHLVMEVSSHALCQHRVTGVDFTGAVFTNLTQDHFDYHGTLEAYTEAKSSLFTNHLVSSGGYAIFNTDDDTGNDLAERFPGIGVRVGTGKQSNMVIVDERCGLDGLSWTLMLKNGVWPETPEPGVNQADISSPLIGAYNISNCTLAAAIALLEGLSLPHVVVGLKEFRSIPGRLQAVPNTKNVHVFVDYAHTPDAVRNVLLTLRDGKPEGARIITVIGCGGDRDQEKRPLMGAAAQQLSNITYLTSDNPRSEDPDTIIGQILTGIDSEGTPVHCESDRRRAIQLALGKANAGDIVLIAGKGHEDYQILSNETIHFSDAEEALAYFAQNSDEVEVVR